MISLILGLLLFIAVWCVVCSNNALKDAYKTIHILHDIIDELEEERKLPF